MRVFKTSWFTKAAKKMHINDTELSKAITEVMQGQAVDLGGSVFKKRLNGNKHRSIILAKGGRFWVYEYLFAKKDRENIDDQELDNFKLLAKAYANLSQEQISNLLKNRSLVEINYEKNT